jgi:hypothetical protein
MVIGGNNYKAFIVFYPQITMLSVLLKTLCSFVSFVFKQLVKSLPL